MIDRRKLARLWQAGVTVDAISRELGCAVSTVHNTAGRMGLPPRRVTSRTGRQDNERTVGRDWLAVAQRELYGDRPYATLEPGEWCAVVDRARALHRISA